VADARIKFPTDLDLLSDSRVKAKNLIDYLCKEMDIKDKPRTYRKVARKERNQIEGKFGQGKNGYNLNSASAFPAACGGVSEQNTGFLFGIGDSSRLAARSFNQIRAKLSSKSTSWMEAIIFVMNVLRYTRDLSGSLLK